MTDLEAITAIINALDEPALFTEAGSIQAANQAAMDLFARPLLGRDIRLAIRHPLIVDHVMSCKPGQIDITGLRGIDRRWTVSINALGPDRLLIRLVDRSAVQSAEKMRVDFVANASHELRTPLATILGYAETLADEPGIEEATIARFGGIIRSEAKRMLRIVEDLMSLSRIESERYIQPTDLVWPAEIARLAVERARPLAESSHCSIRLEVDEDLLPVRADQEQMLQLLDNLIANAIRYGCSRSSDEVMLKLSGNKDVVVFEVSDRGEGIDPKHLPRLTERFYRVDDARSRETGGTGLGLAIVKHIVERHRGQLDISSARGKGTTVRVTIPIHS